MISCWKTNKCFGGSP